MHSLDNNQTPVHAQTFKVLMVSVMSQQYHTAVFVKFTSKVCWEKKVISSTLAVQTRHTTLSRWQEHHSLLIYFFFQHLEEHISTQTYSIKCGSIRFFLSRFVQATLLSGLVTFFIWFSVVFKLPLKIAKYANVSSLFILWQISYRTRLSYDTFSSLNNKWRTIGHQTSAIGKYITENTCTGMRSTLLLTNVSLRLVLLHLNLSWSLLCLLWNCFFNVPFICLLDVFF